MSVNDSNNNNEFDELVTCVCNAFFVFDKCAKNVKRQHICIKATQKDKTGIQKDKHQSFFF